jgi:DNA-binding NarL/FixJ family response regulator
VQRHTGAMSQTSPSPPTLMPAGGGPAERARKLECVNARPNVRLLIADGQGLVRAGFRALLESAGRMSVVGEAATADETLDLVRRARPDVVLLDANLPGQGCVEVTRQILSQSSAAVMLLTATAGDERIFAALHAGATGLLLKDTESGDLVRAIHALARGEVSLSGEHVRQLIAELVSRPQPGRPRDGLLDELTAREREVVVLVALGLSNDEIADRIVVTPATAKTHVSRAMIKLGTRDRAKLVVFAYEAGLVRPRADFAARASGLLAAA